VTDVSAFSAPGKLMLFGEFAVLEGELALALCFDRRIRCEARGGGGALGFDAPQLLPGPVRVPLGGLSAGPPRPELALLWPLIAEAAPRLGGLSLRFDATFPSTWGLGSSSASSLAAVAAVRRLLGEEPDDRALFGEVRALPRALQGSASGYDAATQLLGGVVLFADPELAGAEGPVTLERLAAPALPWRVGYTGRKASTGGMVRSVRRTHPRGAPIYRRIGQLARDAVPLLLAGDLEEVGEALNRGHGQLTELGAVPADLQPAMAALQADPAVAGARMCGAGGGDCVLVLAADGGAEAAMERAGLTVLPLTFTPHGLRAEPIAPEAP
jgi:mevalonate kinase